MRFDTFTAMNLSAPAEVSACSDIVPVRGSNVNDSVFCFKAIRSRMSRDPHARVAQKATLGCAIGLYNIARKTRRAALSRRGEEERHGHQANIRGPSKAPTLVDAAIPSVYQLIMKVADSSGQAKA